jgi:site-specific recombinase XerD
MWLSKLGNHLAEGRFAASTSQGYVCIARHFLIFLARQRIAVGDAALAHVEQYLQQAERRYRRHHGHSPEYRCWRYSRTGGIHMLLRLAQRRWPPAEAPTEMPHRELCEEYAQWMTTSSGIAQTTVSHRCNEACRFLDWLGDRAIQDGLARLTVLDVDTYMKHRTGPLRRPSIHTVGTNIRSFLRWLHARGQTTHDLSPTVIVPTLYACESIPSALRSQDVQKVLACAQEDSTSKGLRDYAILMLLSTYGMRAGEITALRLDDVDWRKEDIRIHHSKTGATSHLPLLPEVGEALLRYLQRARPRTSCREIFLRCHAPYWPFRRGNCLYNMVERRLEAAGVLTKGKRGPHAFRHARAVSMLRAAVSVKEIGDLLGHRAADSTMPYLKLATEDLRAVALEIPTGRKA